MKRPRTVRDVAGRGAKQSNSDESSPKEWGVISAESFPGRIDPKWAWHYRVLNLLRERLLQDRRHRLAEVAQPLEPHSMSHADSATDEFDHNLALATLSIEQDSLHEIDAALSRISNGTYGVCEETGQPIPLARLKVLPWTRFAREVEAQHETAGAIKPPHLGELGSVRGPLPGELKAIPPTATSGLGDQPKAEKVRRRKRPSPHPARRLAPDEWNPQM